MIVTSFTPWRELLARADEALTAERKAQALTEPFALLESLMQVKVHKWAVNRRHHIRLTQGTRSRAAFVVTLPPAWSRRSAASHAWL
jgi:hypothetical protein